MWLDLEYSFCELVVVKLTEWWCGSESWDRCGGELELGRFDAHGLDELFRRLFVARTIEIQSYLVRATVFGEYTHKNYGDLESPIVVHTN